MASDDTPPPDPALASAKPAPATGVADMPVVEETESGQKLLQFLQRRLNLPPAMLHRWVRTGQIRINGGRCKPFTRVQTGDLVRLPPFALKMAAQSDARVFGGSAAPDGPLAAAAPSLPPLPPIVGQEGQIWAFFKPAGLPTHPGTGHSDSLATRLAGHYADAPFKPTPAHRLDKDTSGILLVGASFTALTYVQQALRDRTLVKEYVAWVRGRWPYAETRLLCQHLRKNFERGYEKVRPAAAGQNGGQEALCLVRPLRVEERESLLLIRLLTGRTHQIRVQLADLGHPVLGDAKYGLTEQGARLGARQIRGPMYLHALRVMLPGGRAFACLPQWDGERALHILPESLPAGSATPQPDSLQDGAFPLAGDDATITLLR